MRRSSLSPSPSPSASLKVTATCLLLASSVVAQTSNLFRWSFEDTSIQTTIPVCKDLPISISGDRGVAPYYMIALAVDGTPTTSLIGTSDDELSYQVRHPVGTRLLLSVTDSEGNPGGTFAPMTVVSDNSTACVNTPPKSPTFTVHTNITRSAGSGDLREASTCDVLALVVKGGRGPYQIMAIASSSPAVTNATMPAGDNVFSYVNRASPGGFLVAAVSDSTGQWATGTPLFATKGSTSTDCPNLISSSRNDPNPPADPASGSGGGDDDDDDDDDGNTGSDPTPGTDGNGNSGTPGNGGNTPDPGNAGNNGNNGGNTNNGNTGGGDTNNSPGPGNNNTNPPGNSNTPGNSNNANSPPASEKPANNTALIVGLSAGLGGAAVLGVGVALFIYLRKKMRIKELEDDVILGFSGTKGPAGMKPGAMY